MKTLEETILQMKQEIISDVMELRVPANVKNFGELHDFVDANEYGGFCEDPIMDEIIAHFGGRDACGNMPDGALSYMNSAQNQAGAWIELGGLVDSVYHRYTDEDFTPVAYGDLLKENKALQRQVQAWESRWRTLRLDLRALADRASDVVI